jgi:aryl-alcohol dehydrogenase-like predicted oxidoreductase
MEYRQLGASGLMVPALSFGAATFASGGARGFAAVEDAANFDGGERFISQGKGC